MRPRSAEFLDAARRRLTAATSAAEDHGATALSAAYYAMLYAARAALSERDTRAKTHVDTWREFRQAFVEPRLFDGDALTEVQKVQPERERADYQAG